MSRSLDNVNPTIFAPTGSTTSRRTKSAKAMLWVDDAAEYQELAEKSDSGSGEEDREEIDAEEVFGESSSTPSIFHQAGSILMYWGEKTCCARSPIQNTRYRLSNFEWSIAKISMFQAIESWFSSLRLSLIVQCLP